MTEYGSAQLRTMREACGLTAQAAADLVGVSLRTWQYWESPESTQAVKPDVIETLGDLIGFREHKIDEMSETLMEMADALEAQFGPSAAETPLTLTRYRSQEQLDRVHPGFPGGIGMHNAILTEVMVELAPRAVTVWAPDVE